MTERNRLEILIRDVNAEIRGLTDLVLQGARSAVNGNLVHPVTNSLFSFDMQIEQSNDNGEVLWDKGIVVFVVTTTLVAGRKVHSDYTAKSSVCIGVDIRPEDITIYNALTTNKAMLLDQLAGVNDRLTQLDRKERQIASKITELKLVSAGMGDLLTAPELLELVDVK